MMKIIASGRAKKVYPTGNPNFSVMQAFPAGLPAKDVDPFLMCDYFSFESTGQVVDEDEFPIDWHPHRGMDICTYLKQGVGRHADSLGNRETFKTPGMQWISVGSGIEHAEGGGTPLGQVEEGFQLWCNTPSLNKMDYPRYGTEDSSSLGYFEPTENVKLRILAGNIGGMKGIFYVFSLKRIFIMNLQAIFTINYLGRFQTFQPIEIIDLEFGQNTSYEHSVATIYDNCILFIYHGSGTISGSGFETNSVIRLDAGGSERKIQFSTKGTAMKVLLFSGKQIKEEIAWHGPFVMNTQKEIQKTIQEYQRGDFPPKRTPWDYKSKSSFPNSQ